jgi:alpha-tubulin suppressor-like RCC1 family protein
LSAVERPSQLGNGRNTVASTRPVQVPGLFNVIQVAAGDAHSLALTSGGMVWVWGENLSGWLGNGTTNNRSSPVPVLDQHRQFFIGVKWISAGDDHNLAVAGLDSSVWAWGSNHCTDCFGPPAGQGGQLGDGSTTDRPLATHIGLPGTRHRPGLRRPRTQRGAALGWQDLRLGRQPGSKGWHRCDRQLHPHTRLAAIVQRLCRYRWALSAATW